MYGFSDGKNTSMVIIFIVVIITFLIALIACFSVSSVGQQMDTYDQDISDLEAQNSTLLQKTTDLTYSTSSNFSQNLNVGGVLTSGGKNINQTLSTMTTSKDGIVSFTNDVLIKELNVYENIVELNDAVYNGIIENTDMTLENLTVTGKTETHGLSNVGQISTINIKSSEYILKSPNTTTGETTYITFTDLKNQMTPIGGISVGTGNGSTYTTFGAAISSTSGVGFVKIPTNSIDDAVCKIVFNLDLGLINLQRLETESSAIKSNNATAGYCVKTEDNTASKITGLTPVVCTLWSFYPQNSDNCWILNPGFMFYLYQQENFGGNPFVIDNTTSSQSIFFEMVTGNGASNPGPETTKSIKVYYNLIEKFGLHQMST